MSGNCGDELSEGNLVEDDVFSEICVKYTNLKHKLDNINEDKHKLSNAIYKNYVPKDVTKDTNFVLSQINQNVDMLESSGFCAPVPKIYSSRSAKDVSKTFLAFADLKHDSNDQDDVSDDQWDNNTQIAQIADNIDALTFIINQENTANIANENNGQEKIFENIFLSDLKDIESNSDNFQKENFFPTSPVIHVSQNVSTNEEYAETSSKIKRKRTQNQSDKSDSPISKKCNVGNVDFHGFFNGRNEKIKISDDALSKVKNIFTDIDSNFTKEIDKNYIDLTSCDVKEANQTIQNNSKNETGKPFEFKTANNKSIAISNDALNKAKVVFVDFDLDTVNKRDLIIIDDENEIDDINFNSEDSKAIDAIEKSFFMTANNKKIIVSEDSLKKAKAIFKDIDLKSDDQNLSEKSNSNSISCKENKTERISLKKVGNIEETFSFMTANNKKISVSDAALNKAKSIFKDIDSESNDRNMSRKSNSNSISCKENETERIGLKNVENTKETFSFMTANNKKISVSNAALNKAKSIFKDIDSESNDRNMSRKSNSNSVSYEKNKTEKISPKYSGNTEETFSFMTANNKKISVSDAALNKAKSIFKDIDLENDEKNQSKKSNSNSISCKENETERIGLKNVENTKETFSFMTANNKKISVSDAALNKAKSIFKDIDAECNNQNSSRKFNSNSVSYEENKTESINPTNIRNTEEPFSFTTARNKKISISDAALNKAKGIFEDIDLHKSDENRSQKSEKINAISKDPSHVDSFGFTTGNNKKISVSENSLNKARAIFNDLDSKDNFRNFPANSDHVAETDTKDENTFGFTTANNKKIKISDEALKIAKGVFLDMESLETNKLNLHPKTLKTESFGISTSDKNIEKSNQTLEKTGNYKNNQSNENKTSKYNVPSLQTLSTNFIMNDEIWFPGRNESKPIKNNESISTHQSHCSNEEIESFNSPSSPIIQTKKPIKRKKIFKVPYRKEAGLTQDSIDNSLKLDECTQKQSGDTCISNSISLGTLKNDKQNRNSNIIKLKNLSTNFELSMIESDILKLTPRNFNEFVFKENRIGSDTNIYKNTIQIDDIIKIFTEHTDINEKLIPMGWIHNHIKWIIWKLASYERSYKKLVLTVPNVLMQLKYRYDRELCDAERPILRKILENDDVPSKRMVLCVSNIIKTEENADGKKERVQKSKYEVELTDGWYDVTATIDPILSLMIDRKKIIVGTKLIMSGAELSNCPQGISPLEEKGNVRLKIWANNCRRCSSWMKLGLQKNCDKPISFKLKTCKPGSGPIPILRIIPINIYPILFLNKLSDGTVVMNSDKIQHLQNSKTEDELQKKIEQIYEQVQKEYCDAENSSKKSTTKAIKRKLIDSAEDLIDAFETSADPAEFLNGLSADKRNTMEQYMVEKNMKVRQKIDDRVRSLMQELSVVKEQPVKVLKARIVSLDDDDDFTSAILTIWKPDEAMLDFFKEGITLDVTNLTPTGIRSNELHLSAGKRSTFTEVQTKKLTENYLNIYKLTNKCTEFEELYSSDYVSKFNEINLVGVVVDLIPNSISDNEKDTKMQTLYLTNERSRLMAVNFWGGVKKYGFNKIIEKGAYLACSNLQFRTQSIVKRIRQLHVTELTNFMQYPKKEHLLSALQSLKTNMANIQIEDFLKNCSEELYNSNMKKVHVERTNYLKNCIVDELDDISSIDFNSSLTDKSINEKFKNDCTNQSKLNLSAIISDNTINANQNTSLIEMRINKLKLYGEPPPLAPIVLKNSPRVNKKFVSPTQSERILDRSMNETRKIIEESDYSPPLSLE